jgi:ABC-type oligopeptide transport system ATPase subunit
MIPFIQARNITLVFSPKNREPVTALSDFSLEVGKGEFVSIVGPSGCGKSSFINILLGLIKPDSGEIQLNDTRITGCGSPFSCLAFLLRMHGCKCRWKKSSSLTQGMSVPAEHRMVAHTGVITVARRLAEKA